MIHQLRQQRDEVLHLGGFPSYLSSSSESSSDDNYSTDGGNGGAELNAQVDKTQGGKPQVSNPQVSNDLQNSAGPSVNVSETSTNSTSFKQDTSHITSDDLPFDIYDE